MINFTTISYFITMSEKNKLKEIAQLFFKLGCIAFGRPAAHIAMMEDEVVHKRKLVFFCLPFFLY